MSTQISLKDFEEIYNQTYDKTLKYIICKCSNIEDVNDLLQDTYVELYKILKRKRYIEDAITKFNAQEVWRYIKKKDIKVIKIFYLYYYSEFKISEIAKELNLSESNVKNVLYRTIKDIKKNVKIEGDLDVY